MSGEEIDIPEGGPGQMEPAERAEFIAEIAESGEKQEFVDARLRATGSLTTPGW